MYTGHRVCLHPKALVVNMNKQKQTMNNESTKYNLVVTLFSLTPSRHFIYDIDLLLATSC